MTKNTLDREKAIIERLSKIVRDKYNLPKDCSFDKKEDIIAFRNKIYEESLQESFSKTGIRQMKIKSSNDNSIAFENSMGSEIEIRFAN